jgi:hypothetical protein
MIVYGRGTSYSSAGKIVFGDFGRKANNGWNVFIGEYGAGDSDKLWLHGKNGIYLTYQNSDAIVAFFNPSTDNAFNFNYNVKINGSLALTSDERLKEDISPIRNSLTALQKLQGVSYYRKIDSSKMININYQSLEDRNTGIETDPSRTVKTNYLLSLNDKNTLNEKKSSDLAFQEQWNKRLEQREPELGLVAQNVKEVFPELVTEDIAGILSVNYIGLIPVIIESIKEQEITIMRQQATIDTLQEKVEALTELLLNASDQNIIFRSSPTQVTTVDGKYSDPTDAVLYQNNPNPFNATTEIRYSLPKGSDNATICIFDWTGKMLKTIPAGASGVVEIKGSNLKAGIYSYALFIEGTLIDTKKMILTK